MSALTPKDHAEAQQQGENKVLGQSYGKVWIPQLWFEKVLQPCQLTLVVIKPAHIKPPQISKLEITKMKKAGLILSGQISIQLTREGGGEVAMWNQLTRFHHEEDYRDPSKDSAFLLYVTSKYPMTLPCTEAGEKEKKIKLKAKSFIWIEKA